MTGCSIVPSFRTVTEKANNSGDKDKQKATKANRKNRQQKLAINLL